MKDKKIAEDSTEIAKKSQENSVSGNKIYILGSFDRSISSEIIPAFSDLIDNLSSIKDPVISIYINSYGGYACELFGLMAMIDLAKIHGIKIVTYNIGCAYSCGSLLAILGDIRFMYKYATNLPHLGQAGMSPQTVEQLERGIKHISDHFDTIKEIYATHTKMPRKMLERVLKDDDYFMNAKECLKYGFCDEII